MNITREERKEYESYCGLLRGLSELEPEPFDKWIESRRRAKEKPPDPEEVHEHLAECYKDLAEFEVRRENTDRRLRQTDPSVRAQLVVIAIYVAWQVFRELMPLLLAHLRC